MSKPRQPERDAKIAAAFKRGETTPVLARQFGLSRSQVGAIVRQEGLTWRDGGRSVRNPATETARLRAKYLRAKNAAGARATLGCSLEKAIALNEGLPLSTRGSLAARYRAQRLRASNRNIGWEFTFPTWVAVWEASGHLHERGRVNKGSYVMARHGDTGPYSPTNVYITTLSQNFLDYHEKARAVGYWNQSK